MVSRRTSEKGGRGKMKKLCGDSTPLTTCKKMQPIRENGLSVCACSKSPLAAQESMQRFSCHSCMSVCFTIKRIKPAFMYQEYMSLVMKGCCVCLCKLKITQIQTSFLKISLTPHADAHFCHRVRAGRRNSSRAVECALFACVCVCVLAGAAEQSWRKNKETTGRIFFLVTSGSTGRAIKRVMFRRTSPSEPWERALLLLCDKIGILVFLVQVLCSFHCILALMALGWTELVWFFCSLDAVLKLRQEDWRYWFAGCLTWYTLFPDSGHSSFQLRYYYTDVKQLEICSRWIQTPTVPPQRYGGCW